MLSGALSAQPIPSSCNPPWVLQQEYDLDIKGLTVKYLYDAQSPDTVYVNIPQAQQQVILEGMAAIFNVNHPARDSVFDLYCVHDMAWQPVTHGIIVMVDPNEPWTQQWQNLQTLTGLAQLDTLLVKYGLQVTLYFSFIDAAVLETPQLLNIKALADSLMWASPAILAVDPDLLIGAAGAIVYTRSGEDRYYDFTFQWNDCFDGCDNWHTWKFKVYPDCSVEYLGYDEGGFFGIEPLPAPVNCNITTGLPGRPRQAGLVPFPNPAGDRVQVRLPEQETGVWTATVLDLTGRPVNLPLEKGDRQLVIHTAGLPGGVYLVVVESPGGKSITRFIRN